VDGMSEGDGLRGMGWKVANRFFERDGKRWGGEVCYQMERRPGFKSKAAWEHMQFLVCE